MIGQGTSTRRRGACAPQELSLGLGLGLGGPWVALGWPKRGPRATQASRKGQMEEMLCLQQKVEKGGGGPSMIARIAKIG